MKPNPSKTEVKRMGKKDDQLGMSFSRASGRLKKTYLLHLLQRLGEDSCYRCSEKIETIEELSIEHKQPWLDVDPALFWDLENIAHSHLSCNNKAGRKVGAPGPRTKAQRERLSQGMKRYWAEKKESRKVGVLIGPENRDEGGSSRVGSIPTLSA